MPVAKADASVAVAAGGVLELGGVALMLIGVAIGTATWFTALCGVLMLVRRRVGPRALRGVDVLAGSGLVLFGGVLGARTLGEERG